eukprot:1101884-Pyramimonas_sp.AAC.1
MAVATLPPQGAWATVEHGTLRNHLSSLANLAWSGVGSSWPRATDALRILPTMCFTAVSTADLHSQAVLINGRHAEILFQGRWHCPLRFTAACAARVARAALVFQYDFISDHTCPTASPNASGYALASARLARSGNLWMPAAVMSSSSDFGSGLRGP